MSTLFTENYILGNGGSKMAVLHYCRVQNGAP